MEYADILHRCFRCGYCKYTEDYYAINCPAYQKFQFESYSPGGRLWLIRAWLNHEIKTSTRLKEILYACTTCGNCVEHCIMKFKDQLVDTLVAARNEMVNEGFIPHTVRDYLRNVQLYGNPYKKPQKERGKWAERTDIKIYKDQEYLFYVGCVSSYEERGQRIARAVVELMDRAGVSFGILGDEEICDGNEVRVLGEFGLFQLLAEKNIEIFRKRGIQKIITLSPHSFNVMKNEYPKYEKDLQIWHYTQILANSIFNGRISSNKYKVRVTFHDPCYLGRHNHEYEAPRKILRSIPGVELIEMNQNRGNALCCGGGGGNFFTDVLGTGPCSPSRIRVRHALDTLARFLVVACPQCAKMLEEGIKAEEVEDRLEVIDVAEFVTRTLSGPL